MRVLGESGEGEQSGTSRFALPAYRVHLGSEPVDPHAQVRDLPGRPRRNRRRNRSVALQAASRSVVASWAFAVGQLALPEAGAAVAVWLATRPLRRKTRGLTHAGAPGKGRREARVNAALRAETPYQRCGRGPAVRRLCSRVVQFFVAEVALAVPGAESRARSSSPDEERGRGRAPRLGSAPQDAVHGRKGTGRRIEAELHVTAHRDRRRLAHGAGARAMEDASGRHGDGPSQAVHTRDLGLLGDPRPGESRVRRRRDDRGVRGSVDRGVNGPTRRTRTSVTRRSGQGGVKRLVPQPPSRRVASHAAKGRSASSGEKLRTDETRVLVVESSE